MVRIPERPYAAISGGRLQHAAADSSPVWPALSSLGQGIRQAVETLNAQKQHNTLVEAQNYYTAQMVAWRNKEENREQGPADGGHVQAYLTQHSLAVDAVLDYVRQAGVNEADEANEQVERAFAAWAGEREKSGFLRAASFELGQQRERGRQAHETRLREIALAVENNPGAFGEAVTQAEECCALAVGQGLFTPGEAVEAFDHVQGDLREAAFAGLYKENPARALASLDALGFADAMKQELLRKGVADAAASEVLENTARAATLSSLSMRAAAAERHALLAGDTSQLGELARAFAFSGDMSMSGELSNRAAVYERHEAALRQGAYMPVPDLEASIASLGNALVDGGEGLSSEQKTLNEEELFLLRRLCRERKQALAADPAGAVSPQVAVALAITSDEAGMIPLDASLPDTFTHERLADLRLAAQAGNGVAEAGRRVMTNAESAAYREEWRTANAAGRLRMALSLTAYGRHGGAAAREAGLRPAEHLVLLQVEADPRAATALASVIEANTARGGDAAALLPESGPMRAALFSSEAVKAAGAAVEALAGQGHFTSVFENYARTLLRLTHTEGGDVRAASALLDGRLKSLVSADCALVFDPLVHEDAHRLSHALRNVQAGFAQESKAGGESGRAKSPVGTYEQGVWVNAPDGDGYVLWERGAEIWSLRVRDENLREMAVGFDGGTSKKAEE